MNISLRYIIYIIVFQFINWSLFFVLPKEYVILTLTITSFSFGFYFPIKFKENGFSLFISGAFVWAILWIVSDVLIQKPNPILIYPIPLFSYFLILAGSKFTIRNLSFIELGVWSFLLLFSPVAYSYLGNEDWGIWGRFLIFILAGIGFGFGFTDKNKLFGYLLLILPLGVLFTQRFLNGPEESDWLFFQLHPLIEILGLTIGILLTTPRLSILKFGLTGIISIICIIFPRNYVYPRLYRESISYNLSISIPELKLEGEDQQIHNEIPDKITLVSFWSSTCTPCLREMKAIHAELLPLYQSRVNFISVFPEKANKKEKFLNAKSFLSLGFEDFYDHENILFNYFKLQGVPVSFLIFAKKTVVLKADGYSEYNKDYFIAELKQKIDSLLLVAPPLSQN